MKNNTQIKVITQYNKLHSSTIGYKIAMILLFLEKFYKMQQDKFFFLMAITQKCIILKRYIIIFIYILPVIYESGFLSYNIISKFEKEIALENRYRNKKTNSTISLFNAFPLKSATFLFFSREKQIILRQHETINDNQIIKQSLSVHLFKVRNLKLPLAPTTVVLVKRLHVIIINLCKLYILVLF